MSILQQSAKADKPDTSDKAERIMLRCSRELKRAVRVAAAQQDKSVEQVCVELIERGLEQSAKRKSVA